MPDPNDATTWEDFYLPAPGPLRRRLRVWWWRTVRRYDGELCHECGRPVNLVWWDGTGTWQHLYRSEAGIRCVHCFSRAAWKAGISLSWRPAVDFVATRGGRRDG